MLQGHLYSCLEAEYGAVRWMDGARVPGLHGAVVAVGWVLEEDSWVIGFEEWVRYWCPPS